MAEANLEGTSFQEADLSQATLSGTKLSDANFIKAKLVGTNFGTCPLHGNRTAPAADICNANFTNADLSQAHLCGADFTDAKELDTANFKGAKYNDKTKGLEKYKDKMVKCLNCK